ncbi:general L-amino acid transport system permease protein [Mesorhizobium soli]|nr:general L-amino acid transport system permease protein [Mesorhizobium soli]
MRARRFEAMRLIFDIRFRAWLYQVVAVLGVILTGWYLYSNVRANLQAHNIATGFDYLNRESGLLLSESVIDFQPSDTYARALVAGILNTIHVSIVSVIFATLIGTVVGVARLSKNPLLARLTMLYVEALRNAPLLLQLFLWHAVIISVLPGPRDAVELLPSVFISNSGLVIPSLQWEAGHRWMLFALAVGLILAWQVRKRLLAARVESGNQRLIWPHLLLLTFAPVLIAYLFFHPDFVFDIAEKGRFRITGGMQLKPEFTVLAFGLSTTASAFIAEIVRAGIMTIRKGQSEAAFALGLTRGQTMRLVILPQAVRVIIPPLTNTYLSLVKNSSLAIAIGFPDVVMVTNSTINMTGQGIEGIALLMLIYLSLSITISLFMNWYNAHVALKER